MKRKLLVISLVVICAAILAAGTLAYFNAEGTAHNVQEWADAEKTQPFEDLEGIMPGATVTKIAEVKNTGASDAWIRVSVTKRIELKGEGEANPELVELALNKTDWTEKDGFYYYNRVLKPGEVTEPIFTAVTFKSDMGNEYQNATATVDIAAQAVQSANNGKNALEAAGWPTTTP